MNKPKFKVGDKVKVLRLPTNEEYELWKDSVVEDMHDMVGNEYTIEFVLDNRDYGVKYIKYFYVVGIFQNLYYKLIL